MKKLYWYLFPFVIINCILLVLFSVRLTFNDSKIQSFGKILPTVLAFIYLAMFCVTLILCKKLLLKLGQKITELEMRDSLKINFNLGDRVLLSTNLNLETSSKKYEFFTYCEGRVVDVSQNFLKIKPIQVTIPHQRDLDFLKSNSVTLKEVEDFIVTQWAPIEKFTKLICDEEQRNFKIQDILE
jgi:hypothetical protein